MLAGVTSGMIWFFFFMIAHVAAFRVKPNQDRSKTILRVLVLAFLGHCVSILSIRFFRDDWLVWASSSVMLSVIAGCLVIACLFVLYMPFYYTVDTSLSVETLAMLSFKGAGSLPVSEVKARFTSDKFLLDRLETMCRNGHLLRTEDGTYILLARGRRIASLMLKVKELLKLGAGG